ncbi:hypothetical protein ACIQMR_33475 [Streptomyces sp. NPDC091376]|uniref:BP74-related protein n=1 Tax=Streptomyces sp. NPDC091376 TaxID=3365994 RepID=UPI0038125103
MLVKRAVAAVSMIAATGVTFATAGVARADATETVTRPGVSATAEAKRAALVTFEVGEDREPYSVRVEDEGQIEHAKGLLRGESGDEAVPHGKIVRSPSADNPGYGWHIAPESFSFVSIGSIKCDSVPHMVMEGTEVWEFGYYCPWSARVVSVEALD